MKSPGGSQGLNFPGHKLPSFLLEPGPMFEFANDFKFTEKQSHQK